ncbi:MAG: L,D-transpeptidase family protein [Sphingomicrobium sp.]
MSVRFKTLATFSLLAAVPLGWAAAQSVDPLKPLPPTAPPQTTPQTPVPPEVQVPPPVVLPPAIWNVPDAQQLLAYIQQVGADGLNPANYDPAGLERAIRSGMPDAMSKAANDRFNWLSSDLALGYVPRKERTQWFVKDGDLPADRQDSLLRAALAQHSIPATLNSVLPSHPQYAALKNALVQTPKTETAKLSRIRLNMERWRWLPRDLGNRYVIVNVPAYHVALIENGATRWKQRAVAGKVSTPTPQLSATATGVMLNPWWEVPPSIAHEVAGKGGFVALKDAKGKVQRWRQPPGPSNALGQAKFVMWNSQNIYLHDTNARSRFNSEVRAFSHGCIRTQNIMDLATLLLGDDGGEWTPEKIQLTLASKKTVEAKFVRPLPVYIVYFSSAALNDGTIRDYSDMYGRDPKVLASLNAVRGTVNTQVASR